MRTALATITAAVLAAGCAGPTVVNTDEAAPAPTTTTTAAPSPGPRDNRLLVDASAYAVRDEGGRVIGYFFTTPSRRWNCAILPRTSAGCQAAGGAALTVAGAPTAVPGPGGAPVRPTAVVVEREGPAHLAAPGEPRYRPTGGPAAELGFGRILAAAGFRCNVTEAHGISCLSESSGAGFTFDGETFEPVYTDIAPSA